jgi:hypothetical protein
MRFDTLQAGWVHRSDSPAGGVAVGSRVARLPNGELVCSFMRQSAIGINDLGPVLSRSIDGGRSWSPPKPVWPHLADRWSNFVSISADQAGGLYLFGTRTKIDRPGEPVWSDATQGLKANELAWAHSADGGATWSEPHVIPMPAPGAAEAPGALCATAAGRWLACYSPYNTFDPAVKVERNRVVALRSDDRGASWRTADMLRFTEPGSGGAEAWVVQLADGRLVAACWHVDLTGQAEYPNAFALSHDGGATWTPTRSIGTLGQSTALAPLRDGQVALVYNQRRHRDSDATHAAGEPGVWLAVARPTDDEFGIVHQEVVWRADRPTVSGSGGDHASWTDFAFGEPALVQLPDGTLLVVLWCIQPDGTGIRCVRLRIVD